MRDALYCARVSWSKRDPTSLSLNICPEFEYSLPRGAAHAAGNQPEIACIGTLNQLNRHPVVFMQPHNDKDRCSPANSPSETLQSAPADSQRPEHRRFWYRSVSESPQANADKSSPKRPVDQNEVRR
jgi:hypothetical protein